jgi:hypothetical protein
MSIQDVVHHQLETKLNGKVLGLQIDKKNPNRTVVNKVGERVARFKWTASGKVNLMIFVRSPKLDKLLTWKERSSNTSGYQITTDDSELLSNVADGLVEGLA